MILDPQAQAQDGKDGSKAVQAAGRLAVLDLVDRAGTYPSRQCELVLAQSQRPPAASDRLTDLGGVPFGRFKFRMHNRAY
jgi:hypothetical protein